MSRMDNRRYERHVMLAMLLYMVVLFVASPLLHATRSLPLKVLLALVPVLPVLYVIALMWWRVRDSDELEQRAQLVALGVATALVSAASLVVGFLSAGGVLPLQGDVLIWVFPALMASYGVAYKLVSRHYGMDAMCAEEGSPWLPWFFALFGATFLAFALYLWTSHRTGEAVVMIVTAGFFGGMSVRVWRRRAQARRRAEHGDA